MRSIAITYTYFYLFGGLGTNSLPPYALRCPRVLTGGQASLRLNTGSFQVTPGERRRGGDRLCSGQRRQVMHGSTSLVALTPSLTEKVCSHASGGSARATPLSRSFCLLTCCRHAMHALMSLEYLLLLNPVSDDRSGQHRWSYLLPWSGAGGSRRGAALPGLSGYVGAPGTCWLTTASAGAAALGVSWRTIVSGIGTLPAAD